MNNSINLPPLLISHRLVVPASPRFATRFLIRRVPAIRSRKYSLTISPPLPSPRQMLIRACAYTHTARACTRLVLHRRPSYESLDALSRRWISRRGTLLQQVHRGAASQSALDADSAARPPCPRSCVTQSRQPSSSPFANGSRIFLPSWSTHFSICARFGSDEKNLVSKIFLESLSIVRMKRRWL